MKKIILLLMLGFTLLLGACKVSYSFNGASIDYNVIKTIQIHDFNNHATLVYAPLAQMFNERIRDVYTRNTKLTFTDQNPNIEIEGEIVRYDFTPQAVKDDQYASQTRLTVTVRVRYRNNVKPEEDKDNLTLTAYRDFSSDKSIDEVQNQLVEEINEELVDQIFNETMSNW